MAAPGVEVGCVRLNIFPAFCQSMRVEHKLVWGEENAGITKFLVELVILQIRPAKRALDALCTRGVVASWHKLAAATPGTSGFALFIYYSLFVVFVVFAFVFFVATHSCTISKAKLSGKRGGELSPRKLLQRRSASLLVIIPHRLYNNIDRATQKNIKGFFTWTRSAWHQPSSGSPAEPVCTGIGCR